MTARTSSDRRGGGGKGGGRGGGGGGEPGGRRSGKSADPRTVFVRFEPPLPSVTRQLLTKTFSDAGPVRKCSVIRRPERDGGGGEAGDGGEGGNKGGGGYAFVKYDAEEDAREAARTLDGVTVATPVGGERVRVSVEWAGGPKKTTPSSKGGKGSGGAGGKGGDAGSAPAPAAAARAAGAAPSWIPSSGPSATWAATDGKDDTATRRKKTARVIVRNLSFRASGDDVRRAMEAKFGEVADVHVPLVPGVSTSADDGAEGDEAEGEGGEAGEGAAGKRGKRRKKKAGVPSHRGFAFVTFASAASANKAVNFGGREIQIRGRPVAIDHSVSKAAHRQLAREEEAHRQEEEEDVEDEEEDEERGTEAARGGEDERKEGGGDDDEDKVSSESDSESESDEDDGSEDDESSSGSEEEGDDEGSAEKAEEAEEGGEKPEPPLKGGEDEDDDADGEETERPESPRNDVLHTVFLRNLPYDAARNDVFDAFRSYGRVASVYLVKDRDTGVSRGTAFVHFETEGGCLRALEAAGSNEDGPFVGDGNDEGQGGGGGIYLGGRRVLVDRAVDRRTAEDLKDDGAGTGSMTRGKDKRHLYLRDEGRVHDGLKAKSRHRRRPKSAENDAGPTPWDELPPSDQRKRSRSHSEKLSKLRSPLFFVNPLRLSIKNLAKHVDEAGLRKLLADGIREGLGANLVTGEDVGAHWRAQGEMTPREIRRKLALSSSAGGGDEGEGGGPIIPPLRDTQRGIKHYIPSVYIDRDFTGLEKRRGDAPSRGFAFAEFAHHSHALACLRELNNNPAYSEGFAAGGRRAAEMMRRRRGKGKRGKRKNAPTAEPSMGGEGEEDDEEFVGGDGRVLLPRLIVEFAVENAAKARLQMERRRRKAELAERSRAESRERNKRQNRSGGERGGEEEEEEKGEGSSMSRKERRAAKKRRKRERKRRKKEEEGRRQEEEGAGGVASGKKAASGEGGENHAAEEPQQRQGKPEKPIKPPKKKRKVDREEEAFDDMVRSYRETLAGMGNAGGGGNGRKGGSEGAAREGASKDPREKAAGRRWFE